MREFLQESLLLSYKQQKAARASAWEDLEAIVREFAYPYYDYKSPGEREHKLSKLKELQSRLWTLSTVLTVNDLKWWDDKYYELRKTLGAYIADENVPERVKVYREPERKSCVAPWFSLIAIIVSMASLFMAIHK